MQTPSIRAASVLLMLLFLTFSANSQTEKERFEQYKLSVRSDYNTYKRQAQDDYNSYRDQCNQRYAELLEQAWKTVRAEKPINPPHPEPVPPVVCPEEKRNEDHDNTVIPHNGVVVVEKLLPQPSPVEPITPPQPKPVVPPKLDPISPPISPDVPVTEEKCGEIMTLAFYGTILQFSMEHPYRSIHLQNTNRKTIADGWRKLSSKQNDNILAQCLLTRGELRLNDWAYLLLLERLSTALVGCSGNDATLLMAWLYCQSGYQMRIAYGNGRLYMLFGCDHTIYNSHYFILDGQKYYVHGTDTGNDLDICPGDYPGEQSLQLQIVDEPLFTSTFSSDRSLQSKRFPSIKVTVSTNLNLIEFYKHYPIAEPPHKTDSRWAMYANTPLGNRARQTLYTQLRQTLQGKSKLQAATELLDFVQTAFVYEYDDKVWGCDRAFFPDETLYYPYSDCEDRSILLSRLIRDLLGLDVVLIYYPGHIATAIRFEEEQPTGDYFQLDEGRYFVADPTYTGADIGMTMPRYRGASAKIIRLK